MLALIGGDFSLGVMEVFGQCLMYGINFLCDTLFMSATMPPLSGSIWREGLGRLGHIYCFVLYNSGKMESKLPEEIHSI